MEIDLQGFSMVSSPDAETKRILAKRIQRRRQQEDEANSSQELSLDTTTSTANSPPPPRSSKPLHTPSRFATTSSRDLWNQLVENM